MRKRLQEFARLIAKALDIMLSANPKSNLHFINIAGGPCSDSINALIILNKQSPNLLKNRAIKIHDLDLHPQAPAFGARTLEKLIASGAPLHGVDVSLEYIPYNWSQPDKLREYITTIELKDSIVVASSEGGLFNYGSDDEIIGNLMALDQLPAKANVIFGTLTPDEGLAIAFSSQTGNAITIRRSIKGFSELVGHTPWIVKQSCDTGMNYIVELRKR